MVAFLVVPDAPGTALAKVCRRDLCPIPLPADESRTSTAGTTGEWGWPAAGMPAVVTLYVGTSGWQYRSWSHRLYAGVPQRGWLEYYATQFAVVEVNNTFYQLPATATFTRWAERTPDDFIFACKMSRYLTHVRRLRDPEEPIQRFLERTAPLGDKLGPVLVQLPPTLRADLGLLRATLACVNGRLRVAVEFRHPSWFSEEVADILASHDVALCAADRRGRPQGPLWTTASWSYLRLHEGLANPKPCYGDRALEHWIERIAGGSAAADAYVFFNNDTNGCATADAGRFARLARRRGIAVSRAPGTRPENRAHG